MNILFVLKKYNVGGVESVTIHLANKFREEGHNVCIFTMQKLSNKLDRQLLPDIGIIANDGENAYNKNTKLLGETVLKFSPDVVINQWGQNIYPLRLIRKVLRKKNIKIITVLHCSPMMNGRIFYLKRKREEVTSWLDRFLVGGLLILMNYVSKLCFKYTYRNSDKFVLLSESFIEDFVNYIGISQSNKLSVVHNPITTPEQTSFNFKEKENIILFVGRIDKNKNVQRIIEVWQYLESKYPHWKVQIVGDGDELKNIKKLVKYHKLKHIEFLGFRAPMEFYKKAKILLLTSDFEGVPLVVLEAMNNGVVPIVYGSFSSIKDVITTGNNGFVISPQNGMFEVEKMVEQIRFLIENESKIKVIAQGAYSSSLSYSMDRIYNSWMALFHELNVR